MRLAAFEDDDQGISGILPDGWASSRPGEVVRRASEHDPTALLQRGYERAPLEELKYGASLLLGLESSPPPRRHP